MQTLLGVTLPRWARGKWNGRSIPSDAWFAPSRAAYMSALIALGRKWEAGQTAARVAARDTALARANEV